MSRKYDTLQDAIALAEFAHRGQLDKAGFPYVEHCKRVLANVQAMGARPFVQVAAVLHDVIEDTRFTAAMLRDLGISLAAVVLIEKVSRNLDPSVDYYGRIRIDPDARMIKLADIRDNTAEWRLSYLPPDAQVRMREKYRDALEKLGA